MPLLSGTGMGLKPQPPRLPEWLEPIVANALRELGAQLVIGSLPMPNSAWASDAASLLGLWTKRWTLARDDAVTPIKGSLSFGPSAELANPSTTLRLIGPTDRWAMVEPRVAESAADAAVAAPAAPVAEAASANRGIWSDPAALLAQRTGEARYWDWYQRLWAYSWAHMVDHRYGAWFRILDADNRKYSDEKSPAGKTDYHTMGACYEVLNVLRGS